MNLEKSDFEQPVGHCENKPEINILKMWNTCTEVAVPHMHLAVSVWVHMNHFHPRDMGVKVELRTING